MKYKFYTVEELQNAIKTLEEALMQGVATASYMGGGSITYVSNHQMRKTISELYKALDSKEGTAKPRIRRVYHSVKKGL